MSVGSVLSLECHVLPNSFQPADDESGVDRWLGRVCRLWHEHTLILRKYRHQTVHVAVALRLLLLPERQLCPTQSHLPTYLAISQLTCS